MATLTFITGKVAGETWKVQIEKPLTATVAKELAKAAKRTIAADGT